MGVGEGQRFPNLTTNNIIKALPDSSCQVPRPSPSHPHPPLRSLHQPSDHPNPGSSLPRGRRAQPREGSPPPTNPPRSPALPMQSAAVDQRAPGMVGMDAGPGRLAQSSVTLSPTAGAAHASVPSSGPPTCSQVPPSQQGHSNSSQVPPLSPPHTSTGRRAHGETEAHRGSKLAQRHSPKCGPRMQDHMVQLPGQLEQGGGRVPARLPAATPLALPPVGWAVGWAPRVLSPC